MRSHEFTPEDKPDRKTIKSLEKHYSGYQSDEEYELQDYTGGDYGKKSASRLINKPLGKEKGVVPPKIAGTVAKLDAATARHVTPREITVYYGTGPRRSPDIYKYGASVIKNIKPKRVPPFEMINHAYTSTTLDSSIADNFSVSQKVDAANYQEHTFTIKVPKGFRGAYVGHLSAMLDKYHGDWDELEFILPRGTRFTILPNPKITKHTNPREPGLTLWQFNWQVVVVNTAQQGVAEADNQSSAKSGIYQSEVYGAKAYHSRCLEKDCDWESRRFDRIGQAQDAAKKHAQAHIKPDVTEDSVDEMALSTYKTMGDFDKPGPFRAVDKRLVTHPTTQLKTQRFLEKTPYDFRLFFSNIPGTGKYNEHGPMSPDQIQQVFGDQAQQIVDGSEDAITVVYVGNKGADRAMLTPWVMAHRLGHAIQRGTYKQGSVGTWKDAEDYFFKSVNNTLNEFYGKIVSDKYPNSSRSAVKWDMTPEYNALFNAIGTQRSSRSNQIKRPYEFLYEIFAQYLGTGQVKFNPLPSNLGYGRRVWGNPTKYMNIKPQFRDDSVRNQAADQLAYAMESMFDQVLASSVGTIFVM